MSDAVILGIVTLVTSTISLGLNLHFKYKIASINKQLNGATNKALETKEELGIMKGRALEKDEQAERVNTITK